jgi:hypothetical protein
VADDGATTLVDALRELGVQLVFTSPRWYRAAG